MKDDSTIKDETTPVADEAQAKRPKRHLIRPKWLRITLKTIMWIIVFLLLVPVLLYIPPVQTFVKDMACKVVYNSTGMKIGIDRFRLKWPLDVSLQGVSVMEASGDTMVVAREVIADVKMMPLLNMDVQINRLQLLDGYYRMVSPDSSMVLGLRAGLLDVDNGSSMNIARSEILLNKARLKNGNVSLYMNEWKKKPSPVDTTSTPFLIKADELIMENFTFAMSMLPTIDTLRFNAGGITLRKGIVDLRENHISAASLEASNGDVTYLTPTPEFIKEHPLPAPDTTAMPTPPMIIEGKKVSLAGFKALYAMKDTKPLPGFDPSYIQVSDVNVNVHDFYNAASTLELPISAITAKERSGLQITEGHGTVALDSAGINLNDLHIATPYTSLTATAGVPFALMELKPEAPVSVTAEGSLGIPDVEAFMPTLSVYTSKLPRRSPLNLDLRAEGTLSDVVIPTFDVAMPGVFSVKASGNAINPLDYKKLRGSLDFSGSLTNPKVIEGLLGSNAVRIPTLNVNGTLSASMQTYTADFRLLTSAGDLAANGRVSMTAESYDADVDVRNLNVGFFMPELGVGPVTANIQAHGAGFNPEKPRTTTDIRLDVVSAIYNKQELNDVTADITLSNGQFAINAVSENEAAQFHLDGTGTIAPDLYTFNIEGRLDHLDLHALGVTPDTNRGNGIISLKGTASPGKWIYDVDLRADSLEWTAGNQYFRFPGVVSLDFISFADKVTANLEADKTFVKFTSPVGLKHLVDSFTIASDSIMKQIERKNVNVETLQAALPPFGLDLSASGKGIVGKYLNTMGMSVDTISANFSNDSIISGRIGLIEMANSSLRADTLSLQLKQRGKLLDYRAHMGNRSNNSIAEFANVNINGYLGENRALVSLTQKNQKGETGYRLGFTAAIADSLANIHFTPLKATIAYLPWTFNDDNYVEMNLKNYKIVADLTAASKESSVRLVTQKGRRGNDELNLDIKNLHIQDFLRLSVFAPPITASVDADMKVGYTNNWLYGSGNVGISDFTYDRLRVADMDLKLGAALNDDGTAGVGATLKIDGSNAMTATVRMKPDSITKEMVPEKAGIRLIRFPLNVANAFLGADVARLSGYLKGRIDLSGNFKEPVLNGVIGCDSVGVFVPMIGSKLSFDNDSILLTQNVLNLNRFNIWGANKNPLVLDGTVTAANLTDISFDLGMKADNFQLLNNDKKAKSDIYGKLFLNMNATAKGPMDHFNVNANVDVLSGSDVTYSVAQTTAQLTRQDAADVVKFVNFNDTAKVADVDSVQSTMAMRIVAGLTIQPGVDVTVDIPGTTETGNGKVDLKPSGTLNYFQNYMGDMRLNGQLNLGEGLVRYSLPVKTVRFNINPDSYVLFNGDVMNPTLNISCYDKVKANLLQNGNSQLVDFLVKLNVTNNLSAPKVVFDLSTEDDMSIENDLLSMSADQRSMAAINLLLTGQYNQQGVKTASSDLLTGQLYGMLTGQLNNWLANNVKGVDLSFGVNQYDKTVNGETGSATSYSYTMSKSMFNNRFKISVGGNYTTDASADENFSENLINDISFEYILKQTSNSTMYMRLFRHTGYESILEGEITETGVGFVMKRRLSDLRELFRRHRHNKEDNPADSASVSKEEPAIKPEEHEDK